MATFCRKQVELAAEEEDSNAVSLKKSEASGVGFYLLDLAVEVLLRVATLCTFVYENSALAVMLILSSCSDGSASRC